MIFRWHEDFKKGHLSEKMAHKPGQPKKVIKDQSVNTVWEIS